VSALMIGSGPNGLAAGITLACAGVDAEVAKAAGNIGGGLRSAELTVPGLVHGAPLGGCGCDGTAS
jgi:phytoene dehydrogenase-like protein